MAISVIQTLGNGSSGSTGGTVVMSSASVIGQPIVVTVPDTVPANISSISDDQGNTYTQVGNSTPAFGGTALYWAIAKTAAAPTVTIAMSSSVAWQMQVTLLQGFVGTPTVDASLTTNWATTSGTSITWNPINTNHNNTVLFMVTSSSVGITAPDGPAAWTAAAHGTSFNGKSFYQIIGVGGSSGNYTATLNSAANYYGQLFGIYDNPGTYQFVRAVATSNASPGNTASVLMSTCVAGDTLLIAVLKKTTDTVTMSDASKGNTFVHQGTTPLLGSNAIYVDFFTAANALGGSATYTATESTNSDICAIYVAEYSGLSTSGTVLGTSFNAISAPGSGANKYSSNSITYSLGAAPGAAVWGFLFNQPGTAAGGNSNGTGYSSRTSTWGNPGGLGGTGQTAYPEDKRVTVSGTLTTTWFIGASNASDNFYAGVLILSEPSSAINVTGQTVTSAYGTIGEGTAEGLTHQTITSAEGTATSSVTLSLGSQTATFNEGSLVNAFTLGAQTITSTEGAISVFTQGNVTLALSQQTAQFSLSPLLDSVSYVLDQSTIFLVGQTAVFVFGVIGPEVDEVGPAQTLTSSEGTITESFSLTLGSLNITSVEGVIVATSGANQTITLIAQAINSSQGAIGFLPSYALTALTVTSTEGTLTFSATGDQAFGLGAQTSNFIEGIVHVTGPPPGTGPPLFIPPQLGKPVTTRTFSWLEMASRAWGSEFRAPDHRIYQFSGGNYKDSTDLGTTGIYSPNLGTPDNP